LPLFRSDQQHTLLCMLFVLSREGESFTQTQLAERTGISLSTVSREIRRLETSEIVIVKAIGKARLVQANWISPMAHPLRMMLTQTCGPLCELQALYTIAGVAGVMLFGSWAQRYNGTPGPYPNDVDVLVIGDNLTQVDEYAVQLGCSRAARTLQSMTGGPQLDINPSFTTGAAWNTAQPGTFLHNVIHGPLVKVYRPVANPVNAPVPISQLPPAVGDTVLASEAVA
jgi:Winged helix-turn-helix DNA-binding